MVVIVIIDKNGTSSDKNIKKFNLDDLYKKCNFRKNSNFDRIHTFKINDEYYIHVYGKDKGKSNQVNKFEFPPPIDTTLYFGNMVAIKSKEAVPTNDNVLDYTSEKWMEDYEILMGGFENIENSEDEEDDELENYPKSALTKDGYLKDDFVVDDNSSQSELSEESYDSE